MKTAVEQFYNAIVNQIQLSDEHLEMITSYFKQCKEMETQQKEVDYQSGYLDCFTKLMSERLTRDI